MDLKLVKKERKKYDKKGERKILRLKLSANPCNTEEIFANLYNANVEFHVEFFVNSPKKNFNLEVFIRVFRTVIRLSSRFFAIPRSTPRKSINLLHSRIHSLITYIYIYTCMCDLRCPKV